MARLQLLAGALLFSTGGIAIKLSTLTGWQVAGLRAAVAALVIVAFLPAARRGWSVRTCLIGIPYAATFILYTLANKETTAANAIFLQDTAPLYLLLLSPLLLREPIQRWDVVLLAALAGGAWLLFAGTPEPLVTAPRPRLGNVLGLAAAVTWALSLLGMRWIAVRGAHDPRGAPRHRRRGLLARVRGRGCRVSSRSDLSRGRVARRGLADRRVSRHVSDRAGLRVRHARDALGDGARDVAAAAGRARVRADLGLARARRDADPARVARRRDHRRGRRGEHSAARCIIAEHPQQ